MKNMNIIVFDIGGTWFRSGIYNKKGKLIFVSKQPAKNYKNSKYASVEDLQVLFVKYLRKEVRKLTVKFFPNKIDGIGISMGAALNSYNGFIFDSGPLWGPKCVPFDLSKILKQSFKNMRIAIVNDVSAALLREVNCENNQSLSKIMLITISTGIACRVFDTKQKTIPVDKTYGIQGEIGHIPIKFMFNKHNFYLTCDCGGKNHLNAFCSGRGIENIIKLTLRENITMDEFISYVNIGNKKALAVLNAVTKPLAELLLIVFTLDPLIEKVILTGGVTKSIGSIYVKSLLSHLNKVGMYQITNKDSNFFKRRISLGNNDGMSCLIGAALSFKYNL